MMNTAWYKGCKTDAEKEKVKVLVESNNFLLDKLSEICYNIIKDNEKINCPDYDSAGWAYKQAHKNGENAALRKVIEIIKTQERP